MSTFVQSCANKHTLQAKKLWEQYCGKGRFFLETQYMLLAMLPIQSVSYIARDIHHVLGVNSSGSAAGVSVSFAIGLMNRCRRSNIDSPGIDWNRDSSIDTLYLDNSLASTATMVVSANLEGICVCVSRGWIAVHTTHLRPIHARGPNENGINAPRFQFVSIKRAGTNCSGSSQ